MNNWIGAGRLTKDPEVRYSRSGDRELAIARYFLAVRRKGTSNGTEAVTDFIPCVAFGKAAEFAEKWLKLGTKIIVRGRIQTGSYTNKEGVKIYTTEIVVDDQEFAESKKNSGNAAQMVGGQELPFQNGQAFPPQEQAGFASAQQPLSPQEPIFAPAQQALPQGQAGFVPAQQISPQGQAGFVPTQQIPPQGQAPTPPSQANQDEEIPLFY